MQPCERTTILAALALLLSCSRHPSDQTSTSATGSTGTGTSSDSSSGSGSSGGTGHAAGSAGSGTGTTGGTGTASSTGNILFDVGNTIDIGTGGTDLCKIDGDMDAVGPCSDKAPPDSFDPDVQWAFMGQDGETQVLATPVVANLTDDNDDGQVDLCDVPDVVVTLYGGNYLEYPGHLYVLDGATGQPHIKFPQTVGTMVYPAVADIDDDGVPEILSATWTGPLDIGNLTAWEADGTVLWQAEARPVMQAAVAVGDADNDGDVEILLHGVFYDHQGNVLWEDTDSASRGLLGAMADLDDDGDLEIVLDGRARHHDGTLYFDTGVTGWPHIADLDMDGLPEVLVVGLDGLTLIEHDGQVTYQSAAQNLASYRPAAIHDVDGDDVPEICVGASNSYSVLELDLTAKWTNTVLDVSGFAGGTAFDFLGDGSAEAMYADETTLFVFEGADGTTLLSVPRTSWTQFEYPVVADVDNDGSAEIVVVSNRGYDNGTSPPVQVIRDKQDRWIPARRIWNQHTYHVTNVREDGTIPTVEPKHWTLLNTFRTQAQIAPGGGVCKPEG